ncbi:MAG: glycosyltransferase [Cyanobacteria bacterium J06635_1]
MRVAYLTGEYPRTTDTFIQREVSALRDRDVEVFTYAVRRPKNQPVLSEMQRLEAEGTQYLLPFSWLTLIWAHLYWLLTRPGRYVTAIALAWQTHQPGIRGTLYQLFYFLEAGLLAHDLQRRQIQHLHNHIGDSSGTVAMLASALGDFGYSFTLHGPGIFFEPMRWRLDEKIRRARFVCCISHFCRSQAMVFTPPENWSRLHIVHCGVDPSKIKPIEHSGVGNRLLFVGRLAAAKGLPILFESLAVMRDQSVEMRLTVVGDGPDRQILEEQGRRLGILEQIDFVGYQSPATVQEYLLETDIFVMSSFAEGVPVVLMEAMAAGLPVVATSIAGVSELVENGISGYLVPPGDVETLSQRIATLSQDSRLRLRLGNAGRQKVELDFNLSTETAWLSQIMTSSLQGRVEPVRIAVDDARQAVYQVAR